MTKRKSQKKAPSAPKGKKANKEPVSSRVLRSPTKRGEDQETLMRRVNLSETEIRVQMGLQKLNLMDDTVLDRLLPKLRHVYVTLHPVSKKYIGFLITYKDEVYVSGDNTDGILAVDTSRMKTVDRPEYNQDLSGKGIIDIINMTDAFTIVARTRDGKIFTWGGNSGGELGLGHSNATSGVSQVKGVLTGEKVVQHCCGGHNAFCLTSSGKIVHWGSWSRVFPDLCIAAPRVMTLLPRPHAPIAWIGATSIYLFALTPSGELYSWRDLKTRRCQKEYFGMTKLQQTPGTLYKKVSCGYGHALLLTIENRVFRWSDDAIMRPNVYEREEHVEDILAARSRNVSFCNSSGTIYQWGSIAGKQVNDPTVTEYESFEVALLENDLGMSWKWSKPSDPTEVETEYNALVENLAEKKLVFSVNGAIVAAFESSVRRSPVMKLKLKTDWKDLVQAGKPIELKDIPDKWLFLSLMTFLTDQEVKIADEDLLDLVKLANRYEVFELGRNSAKRLQALLTESNASDIYQVAMKCDISELVLLAGAKSGKRFKIGQ